MEWEGGAVLEQATQANLNSQRIHSIILFLYHPTYFWVKSKAQDVEINLCAHSHS